MPYAEHVRTLTQTMSHCVIVRYDRWRDPNPMRSDEFAITQRKLITFFDNSNSFKLLLNLSMHSKDIEYVSGIRAI